MSLTFAFILCCSFSPQAGGDWWLRVPDSVRDAAAQLGASLADFGTKGVLVGSPGWMVDGKPEAGFVELLDLMARDQIAWGAGANQGDQFGFDLANVGDVNGDGVPDVLVGAPGEDQELEPDVGGIHLYSGRDASEILHQFGPEAFGRFGHAVSGAGDVNSDGFDDLIVGAPFTDQGSLAESGSVWIYSGRTGRLLRRLDGQQAGDHFGYAVANAGDQDGDGIPDQVVGAPGASRFGRSECGMVSVYSSATGLEIFTVEGSHAGDALGISVAGFSDRDGDGRGEILVGAVGVDHSSWVDAGAAFLYSLQSRSALQMHFGRSAGSGFGTAVANIGDVDGDGFEDLGVGAPLEDGSITSGGAAYLFSGYDGSILYARSGGFVGNRTHSRFGHDLTGVGLLDGDSRRDVVIGVPGDPVEYPKRGEGAIYSIGLANPYLFVENIYFSIGGTQVLDLSLDFPAEDAGFPYVILMAFEPGLSSFMGLEVGLKLDTLSLRIVQGDAPTFCHNFYGFLNWDGNAFAEVRTDPVLNHFVGHSFYFVAVSYDPLWLSGRRASIPCHVKILP
ncbi:MAG: hypothetical protein DWQ01_10730 [Planctomycetota bacterium]|nr:MAG: hypothetical protein DWQ01_10730 [Planctomycetota bacterium]